MVNSRNKGARGERELAGELRRLLGDEAIRRGQQFSGSPDSPDVVGVPGLHIECKRVQKLNLENAMKQSERDAGNNLPCVMHRQDRTKWLVTFRLENIVWFCKTILRCLGGKADSQGQ